MVPATISKLRVHILMGCASGLLGRGEHSRNHVLHRLCVTEPVSKPQPSQTGLENME